MAFPPARNAAALQVGQLKAVGARLAQRLLRRCQLKETNRVQLKPPPHTLPQRSRRMQRSGPYHLLPVRCLNDEEPANHFLGFGIRPIRDLRLSAAWEVEGKRSLKAFE